MAKPKKNKELVENQQDILTPLVETKEETLGTDEQVEEPKEEPKEEIKEEIKEEPKEEVKEEVEEEVLTPSEELVTKEIVETIEQKLEEELEVIEGPEKEKTIEEIKESTNELSYMAKKWKDYLEYVKMTPAQYMEKYKTGKARQFVQEIIDLQEKEK